MTPHNRAIEEAARAMFADMRMHDVDWAELPDSGGRKKHVRDLAETAIHAWLASMKADGMAMVPREATEEMKIAFCSTLRGHADFNPFYDETPGEAWAAMWDAAKDSDGGSEKV
jgi:hypothetical protein